ncbi:DNA recombination protein RmuC [Homoserinibacter sp. GY 40078]|uniref:DNA recombination protein RmuC n=1 Tax=Homoserinibacter sp. GY 40078 TaxID=2603275 RepID=UPI0011CC5E80|nr:DNA recombination protein RmuC [Homoserinibacter sp. GY 40078]TXK19572.1 DNA recombination protein RmuC [Homoserinibacter sp. GY 40078]
MDALLPLVIGLAIGLAIGVGATLLVARSRPATTVADVALREAQHGAELARARAEEAALRAEVERQLAGSQAALDGVREQLAASRDQYRELVERTDAEARKRQADAAAESKVLQELAPVKETLTAMQRKVIELESQRAQQHGELTQQLRTATESEERLRLTAEQLASALRNNATRGVWGETQLRTLVESAGLLNRVDFSVQSTIESESGTRRPDMIVTLPGGKSIPVDAKVPYNSFIEASAIPATATGDQEAQRTRLLAQHAKQVRSHVDALASKSYWTGLDASPDFTIAFIPNEPLLAAAVEADPNLMDYAFSKRIILANPGTLWALLKTIAFTWQQDVLTEDAKRLFDLGKELYGRLATLSEHADRLRGAIESTVTHYNRFASSLEQRVLVTARKLDALDESKVISTPATIDETPKRLTQNEFAALDGLGTERPEIDETLVRPANTAKDAEGGADAKSA